MKSKTKVKKDKKTKTKNKNKQRQKQKQSVVVNIDNSRKTVAKNKGEKQQGKASPSIIPQPIYVPQYAPQSFQQNQPATQPFRAEPTRPTVFNPSGSVFNNSNFSVPDDDDTSTITAGSGYSSMPSMKSMASISLPTLQTIPKPSGASVSSAFNPSPSVGGSTFGTAIEPMAEDPFNSTFKEFSNAYEAMPTMEREIGTSAASFVAEPKSNPPSALAIELNDNIETAPDSAKPKDAEPEPTAPVLIKPPWLIERQFVRARGETKKTEPETAQPSESQPVPNADGKGKSNREAVYNNGQCAMINNKGQPCKGVVKPGEIYCATHRKMTNDERADIINKRTMRELKKLKSSGGV